MERIIRIKIIILALCLAVLIVLPLLSPRAQYVAGRMYIRERGIAASLYTKEEDVLDGMSVLWGGGKVTTDADLSEVQVGDMAHLYTVEGEHLVLECVRIRKGLGWFDKPQGDVIVINQKWVYRFTRL
jgi:hypothetical protein